MFQPTIWWGVLTNKKGVIMLPVAVVIAGATVGQAVIASLGVSIAGITLHKLLGPSFGEGTPEACEAKIELLKDKLDDENTSKAQARKVNAKIKLLAAKKAKLEKDMAERGLEAADKDVDNIQRQLKKLQKKYKLSGAQAQKLLQTMAA